MSSNDDGGSKLGRNPRTPGDYEVGYGRPPRAHRFKKGEPSRNPKGRPRGSNRPAPDLVAALWQPVTIRMQGKERKVPYPEAMIQHFGNCLSLAIPARCFALSHIPSRRW